jgi:hypothetical protein
MNNLVISALGNSVFFNGLSANNLLNLPILANVKSLYWNDINNTGWIENLDANGNYTGNTDIAELPAWANECLNIFKTATALTTPTGKEQCKNEAKNLLSNTDWSELKSVSDPQNSPYLANLSEFIEYRLLLRALVTNPVDNPNWPTEPTAQWINSLNLNP